MTNDSPVDPSAESGPVVHDITDARWEARLSAEFSLVRVHAPVYIQDQKAARQRTANAERVALHRERQAEKGLVQAPMPAEVAAAVKAAGGWQSWADAQKTVVEKIVEVVKEVRVEVVREVPVEVVTAAKLTDAEAHALQIGQRFERLTGWRRAIARRLLAL